MADNEGDGPRNEEDERGDEEDEDVEPPSVETHEPTNVSDTEEGGKEDGDS